MKINFASPKTVEKDFTVSASPSWQGVSASQQVIEHQGSHVLVETIHEDLLSFLNFDTLLTVSTQCGDLGVAPKILDSDLSQRKIALQYEGPQWRAAGLHDLSREEVRKNIILLKKQIQTSLQIKHVNRTFELIETLSEHIKSDEILCPKQIEQWQKFAKHAKQKLYDRDFQLVPCHLDGNISNVLINAQNEVKFSHFEFTALADPLQDLGCYLIEVYELKEDAKQGYIEWFGEFDLEKFELAWLYGMLDDLKWGLIAIHLSSQSQRKSLEFGKYASWRFLRFEENLKILTPL